jgi:hypothetical protein
MDAHTPLTEHFRPFMAGIIGGWESISEQHATWNATHSSFGFPRGVRYLTIPAGHINHELGRDYAWIPVTHTHTMQDGLQVGIWFHYMRGCSDITWNVGRTMLARNKCHASVKIEQQARGISWSEALDRVSRKAAHAMEHVAFRPAWRAWYASTTSDEPLDLRVFRRALHRCAHGRSSFGDKGLGDRASASNASKVTLEERFLSSNALDYLSAATIIQEFATVPYDTITFINQCAEGVSLFDCGTGTDANVEIWDIRSLQYSPNSTVLASQARGRDRSNRREPAATARRIRRESFAVAESLPRSPQLYGRLDGSTCHLTRSWYNCFACADSLTERACAFKCTLVARGKFLFTADGMDGHFHYGGCLPFGCNESAWFDSQGDDANVIGLALVWRLSWGPLVGSIPYLE